MKKKVVQIILSSSTLTIACLIIILVPVLMIMDFFGANITDDYVENNAEYATEYKRVLNLNLKSGNGYVPLNRILYFYLENDKFTFDKLYTDNLNLETKKLMEISEVCKISNYKVMSGCKQDAIAESGQIDEEQNKPFHVPVDFSKVTVTSIFMEERVVFGEEDIHSAWDLAAPNQTPVYSVCDGNITKVSFTQKENKTNTSASGGNMIYLECEVDDIIYEVSYAHLYPDSAKVKTGDTVTAGQELAGIGTTGYSTGPHLHFQVKRDGNNVDGMSLIDFTTIQNLSNKNNQLKPYNPNVLQ